MKRIFLISTLSLVASLYFSQNDAAAALAKRIAKSFSEGCCRDYFARAVQARTISQNDKYVQFEAIQMIMGFTEFNQSPKQPYFDGNPANEILYAPLTVMRSDIFENGKVINAASTNDSRPDNPASYYTASPGTTNALAIKRAVEVCGPLNPSMVKFFSYQIVKREKNTDGDNITVISFETLPTAFPKGVRILAKGKIYFNETKSYTERVDISDIVDYYTTHIYKTTPHSNINATVAQADIRYSLLGGRVVTSRISYKVKWVECGGGDHYQIQLNSRVNPIQTKLSEYECYYFTDFVQPKGVAQLRKMMKSISMLKSIDYYYGSYIEKKWAGVKFDGVDMERVRRDLSFPSNSFATQVARNAMARFDLNISTGETLHESSPKNFGEMIKAYYQKSVKDIYPLVYGVKFE